MLPSILIVVALALLSNVQGSYLNPISPTVSSLSPRKTPSLWRDIRGGAVRAKASKSPFSSKKPANNLNSKKGRVNFVKPPSALGLLREGFSSVKPVTRAFLASTLVTALVHMAGLPAPPLFCLNAKRLHEVWRVITAATYLGGPSLSLANNIYFLITYGQLLENTQGTADFAYFLLTQAGMLTVFSLLLQFPFTAQSMLAAIIYCCSRINAMDSIPFQFGLTIKSWQLPFCMLIIDCLAKQSVEAAWPHVLGILSGHIYHFFHDVWPVIGGRQYFTTPQWFAKRFGKGKARKH